MNRLIYHAIVLAALMVATGSVWAGGSGLNVIVVVNQNSTNSVQLGNDYCELRGVPPQNLLRMTGWTNGSINWSPAQFQTYLLNPLLGMIASRGLTNQAQFVLLSMDIPYRVTDGTGQNSTTSALFYGFKTNGAPVSGIPSCSLPDNSSNSYAYSEAPFNLAPPNTAVTNSFLAMMLTDTNLAAAENILARSIAADSTYPTQTVYLAKTDDVARNVRFVEFDNAIFENQVVGNMSLVRTNTDSTAFTNLFGFMTGLVNFSLARNAFIAGSMADNLTSFGGYILENSGQTPALAFLEAGASGSYGTVIEPCNYTQKFPDPVNYFYQARGFSLAEAYYQSVSNPFQGLFVGEPLAAPFAHPGSADWTSVLIFTEAATNRPLTKVDLFVDGTFFQTLTNLPPTAGNVLTVTLNGHTVSYTVPNGATLGAVASGLGSALNQQSNVTHVQATVTGDRIELQSLMLSMPGSNVSVSASSRIGTATRLTTQLTTARPVFLDTVATGYQVVTINNAPSIGDWLRFTFMKTNGTSVTLDVTNTIAGTTIGALAQQLVDLINTNASLQSADGLFASDFFDEDPYGASLVQFYLYSRSPGWPASQILATLTTSSDLQASPTGTNPLADNVSDLRPRNHLYVSSGMNSLSVNYGINSGNLASGYHQYTAVAYEGTSVATQTRVTQNVIVTNASLSASLVALPNGTNATLDQQLQFTVTANTNDIVRIELFSTGGSVGAVTNQATALFNVSSQYLGLGLHPFYAIVTDQAGNRYQTYLVWYRIISPFALTFTGTPPTLGWTAIPGHQYDVQFATNLASAFQNLTTIDATNSVIQWPINPTANAGFYRVQLDP